MLFEQTTTIGVRIYEARRKVLEREQVTVETPYGAVQVKVARRDGKVVNAAPEFDDCQRLATEKICAPQAGDRRRRSRLLAPEWQGRRSMKTGLEA